MESELVTPLVKNNPNGGYNPSVGILRGKEGADILAEYRTAVKRDYENNPNLLVFHQEGEGLVTGSSSLATVVLDDKVLRGRGLRVATLRDLELILKHRQDIELRGTYEDAGLALRSEAEPNEYLARNLTEQLRARDPRLQYPVLVNLTDCTLVKDPNARSSYGLVFKLREDARLIYAPILNNPTGFSFSSADIDETTGLPRKLSTEGNRSLWTIDSGLSRLCLDGDLDLNSYDGDLTYSCSDGRVVVVKVA